MFGVILGTGVVYGLTAKPVARRLGVTQPPAKGVGLVGNESWLMDLARCLEDAGAPVLVDVLQLPADAQTEAKTAGVPVVSALENREKLRQIFLDADLAQIAICTAPQLGIAESEVISYYGRRNVLRLAGSQTSADIDRRLPVRMSRRPFAPGVTFEDIQARVASGATVQVIEDDTDAEVDRLPQSAPRGSRTFSPAVAPREPTTRSLGSSALPATHRTSRRQHWRCGSPNSFAAVVGAASTVVYWRRTAATSTRTRPRTSRPAPSSQEGDEIGFEDIDIAVGAAHRHRALDLEPVSFSGLQGFEVLVRERCVPIGATSACCRGSAS